MKLLQILTIIFCLGIFLIPKDNFYAKSSQENCCKTEAKSDCCKDHNNSSKNKDDDNTQSSCNDNCCSFCVSCFTFIETSFSKSLYPEFSYYKTNKNLQFQYSDPYISDSLKEIWQPPKIA